jgi:hypothetical protein
MNHNKLLQKEAISAVRTLMRLKEADQAMVSTLFPLVLDINQNFIVYCTELLSLPTLNADGKKESPVGLRVQDVVASFSMMYLEFVRSINLVGQLQKRVSSFSFDLELLGLGSCKLIACFLSDEDKALSSRISRKYRSLFYSILFSSINLLVVPARSYFWKQSESSSHSQFLKISPLQLPGWFEPKWIKELHVSFCKGAVEQFGQRSVAALKQSKVSRLSMSFEDCTPYITRFIDSFPELKEVSLNFPSHPKSFGDLAKLFTRVRERGVLLRIAMTLEGLVTTSSFSRLIEDVSRQLKDLEIRSHTIYFRPDVHFPLLESFRMFSTKFDLLNNLNIFKKVKHLVLQDVKLGSINIGFFVSDTLETLFVTVYDKDDWTFLEDAVLKDSIPNLSQVSIKDASKLGFDWKRLIHELQVCSPMLKEIHMVFRKLRNSGAHSEKDIILACLELPSFQYLERMDVRFCEEPTKLQRSEFVGKCNLLTVAFGHFPSLKEITLRYRQKESLKAVAVVCNFKKRIEVLQERVLEFQRSLIP